MAKQVANLLLENLYKRFGLSNEIISDQGPQFAAHAFCELLKLLNATSKLSTAYHPQTDGATKRVNQEIEAYLSIFCAHHFQKNGPENYFYSNSHTITDDMQNKNIPLLNLCTGNLPKHYQQPLKKPNI